MQVIKVQRDSILKPLTTVNGIIDPRPNETPILANVLISLDGDEVTFTGTDREVQIKTKCKNAITVESPTAFTIAAKKVLDQVKTFDKAEVTVSLKGVSRGGWLDDDASLTKVEIRAGNSYTTIQTRPADQFPDFPTSNYTGRVEIPAYKFKYILNMVHYAMAYQDVRFYLNGLRLIVAAGRMTAVATDGRRLAYCSLALEVGQSEGEISATIPRKAVNELRRLLPEDEESNVVIRISESQAKFDFEDIELSTKIIEGKYPEYERVMPKDNDKKFSISREGLLKALRSTSVIASDKLTGVRLSLEPGMLSVQTTNSDQEESNDRISIEYDGEPLEIGFNMTYLFDVLQNLKNDRIVFSLAGPQSSALITMPENDDFKYVLMPMRL